uniref:Uncharacterized protein n=1 Tax=Rhipicephalus zambeziensis TaxID=60191 RepID=A0A224Z0N1_9ACAR
MKAMSRRRQPSMLRHGQNGSAGHHGTSKIIYRKAAVLQLEYRSQQIQAAASTSRKDRASTATGETVAARHQNLRAQQFSTVTKTRRGKRYEELMCDVSTSLCTDKSL